MIVAVPKESYSGEKRVALIPSHMALLIRSGLEILVETGAGLPSGYADSAYESKGAKIIKNKKELFSAADILLFVRGDNPEDLEKMKKNTIFIGQLNPYDMEKQITILKKNGLTAFAMELIPRISRAQSMDVLSSMASIAGYKAGIMAADHLHKIFPMMMTAAGTVTPAKILIIGAGVAGLQAIATTHRLGALVTSYDIRPAVKEQVESLGAKFLELDLDTGDSEDKGGYAREMDYEFYKKQQEMLSDAIAASDVVITTASIPGKKSPVLITSHMVERMQSGSVIIDLAAERGGNCEDTSPGETTVKNGVMIIGPYNLPSQVAYHASQLYSKNISSFLGLLIKEGEIDINEEDEIIKATLISREGEFLFGKEE